MNSLSLFSITIIAVIMLCLIAMSAAIGIRFTQIDKKLERIEKTINPKIQEQ